ncbi:MAG: amidohydrolase family protein [Gemmatimonadota bacterium]
MRPALFAALVPLVALACGSPDTSGARGASTTGSGSEALSDRFVHDLLIHAGRLIDGTGTPPRVADLLVDGGRISFVGTVDTDTLQVRDRFDASGLVVTPGFIDAHAHGDPAGDPAFHNFLAMGVTTIVLGQDGSSPEVASLPAQLAAADSARPGVNLAFLVGHNTVRRESGVGFGDPGSEGLVRMSTLVSEGLAEGAYGLSTGLEYDPGSRSGIDELAAIAGPVAEAHAVISSHLRSEDADQMDASLAELIEQGRRSGARVHVSHMKIVLEDDTSAARRLLLTLSDARAEGIEVTADVYPYTASFTGLSILFPEWSRPPNDYASVVRDRRPDLARHLRHRIQSRNGPDATLFGTGPYAGRTLAEVARERELPFEEILIELGPEGASAAYFVMDEQVMRTLVADPSVVISSDGSPTMQHPRGYGSFARVIETLVIADGRLALEEAVRKMSGATAGIYRLDDATITDPPRGLLREGYAADILAFDPSEIRAVADFEHPHRLAEGMRRVWVNGALAWRDGEPVPVSGHGKVLRATW